MQSIIDSNTFCRLMSLTGDGCQSIWSYRQFGALGDPAAHSCRPVPFETLNQATKSRNRNELQPIYPNTEIDIGSTPGTALENYKQ